MICYQKGGSLALMTKRSNEISYFVGSGRNDAKHSLNCYSGLRHVAAEAVGSLGAYDALINKVTATATATASSTPVCSGPFCRAWAWNLTLAFAGRCIYWIW